MLPAKRQRAKGCACSQRGATALGRYCNDDQVLVALNWEPSLEAEHSEGEQSDHGSETSDDAGG